MNYIHWQLIVKPDLVPSEGGGENCWDPKKKNKKKEENPVF